MVVCVCQCCTLNSSHLLLPLVQNAMNESHILEKMAAEAGQKRPGMKPIKGIT
ncbi:hypothetical protein FD754_014297, partial [Muntiacus muntjak]